MMITFWCGTYKKKEELEILISAIENSIDEIRNKVECFSKETCKNCVAKPACNDLHKLLDHLETVAEDF